MGLTAVPEILAAQDGDLAEKTDDDPNRQRVSNSYNYRVSQAQLARDRPLPDHPTNGDENRYSNKIGSYSKGLPHNDFGEVDTGAFQTLVNAATRQRPSDFENIRLGLGRHLVSPQAGLAYDLEGSDSGHAAMPPAPRFDSAEEASEMGELYWMALARDVNFLDYGTNPTIAAAATDLSHFSDFRGPKQGGRVTPGTLFRGLTPGDLVGPYVSQFLWQDVPFGSITFPQTMTTVLPGVDYMTDVPTGFPFSEVSPASHRNRSIRGPATSETSATSRSGFTLTRSIKATSTPA